MKKLLLFLFLSVISFSSYAQLSGDYYIPQGANPQGFATLASAIDSLNKVGLSGTVYFYIDDNLTETGSLLRMYRGDLSSTNNLVIKPAPTKTPAISITSCTASGHSAYTGITLDSTSYVTFDGSNTVGGSTKDLTLTMNDATNGRNIIQLYGNSDNVTIKNLNITYQAPMSTSTSTRGIYLNGQASGASDNFITDNCNIGDTSLTPYYALGITGSSGSLIYCTNITVKNSNLYGRIRPVYFFYVGTTGTTSEISNNYIYTYGGLNGTTTYTIFFNTWAGTINIVNNHLPVMTTNNTVTSGIYGISALSAQTGAACNIYNNFIGGNLAFTGAGVPTVASLMYLQDNGTYNVYYNSFNYPSISNNTERSCIHISGTSAIVNLKNNILINSNDAANAFCVWKSNGTLTSDYNDLYVSGALANVGYVGGAAKQTLADWQGSGFSYDINSKSKAVSFVSATDLHLTGISNGDIDLLAVPITGITTDIDGNARSKAFPYKGADEGTTKLIPPLSGDYYIGAASTGPGGTDPQFATLREAFDVLNDAAFTGDCNFYITSDITETYTPAVGLGLAINPTPYTVTFKPYTGVQPVITLNYPTDLNGGPSGALVIGIPSKGNISWDSLRTTKNIVIDGSNTIGGTTRDLTIQSSLTAQRNAFPLTIVGDVSNMVVKSTNIYYKAQGVSTSGNLFVSAVQLRSRNYLGINWVPTNILFENNHISANFDGVVQSAQGYGCYQSGTPNVLSYPNNITLKDNLIEGKRRAITLYRAGSHDIFGNEIILNQNIGLNISNEAIYAVDVDTNSVVNIYNNKISKVSSLTNAATFGNTAISIETFGTYNIYNNMIYGFELTAANPVAYVRGIKNNSASATLNLNFNSIYMTNLADIGTGAVTYQGILISNGTNDLKNNIVVSDESDFASYCIYRDLALGTLTSDYNDYYPVSATNGNVGYFNTAAAQTLANWQTASSQDVNSLSVDPQLVSPLDLHFTNVNTPLLGKGIKVTGITTDIDGELRDSIPEIGADEFPGLIPVELFSFSANVVDGKVQLTWKTATEVNNKGFEIQRRNKTEFETIGFVAGNGTTTESRLYSFADNNATVGKYTYRLKQLDYDGTSSYSNLVEVDLTVPLRFDLAQNYPNPFNPATTIVFQTAEPVNVTLSIYNMLGEEVTVLINNQFTNAGQHSVRFDASDLASGTYIYRITAGKFVQTKKMILLK